MEFISVKKASELWGISERRVRILCAEGRIDGAVKAGWSWNIPADTRKPGDGRLFRHIKNFELRTGRVNLNEIDRTRLDFNSIDPVRLRQIYTDTFKRLICGEMAVYGIDEHQVISIISHENVADVPMDMQLLILNAYGIMNEYFIRYASGRNTDALNETELMSINRALYRLIDDFYEPEYRNARIAGANSWGEDVKYYPVATQMKPLFLQYENEWSMLHPFIRAAFLYGELMRIRPFEKDSYLFAAVILAIELMRSSYLPVVFAPEKINELKSALVMTNKRGDYEQLIDLMEESIKDTWNRNDL